MIYRPQIDALRGIAVTGVLLAHFANPHLQVLGDASVRLFFVISGFLITSILLREGVTFAFYIRRAARLWPLLYVTLAAALVFDLGIGASWPWHAAQISNLYFWSEQSWAGAWSASHLWTLSVEEQFYLLWPLIIWLTPRRALPIILAMLLAAGTMYRVAAGDDAFAKVLPLAAFDALAGGALLAIYPLAAVYVLGVVAAPVMVVAYVADLWEGAVFAFIPVCCALVLAANRGSLRLLDQPWLVWIGKISYGVYLLHLFVLALMLKLGWSFPRYGIEMMVVASALTILLATVSYLFFESPIRSAARKRLMATRSASAA